MSQCCPATFQRTGCVAVNGAAKRQPRIMWFGSASRMAEHSTEKYRSATRRRNASRRALEQSPSIAVDCSRLPSVATQFATNSSSALRAVCSGGRARTVSKSARSLRALSAEPHHLSSLSRNHPMRSGSSRCGAHSSRARSRMTRSKSGWKTLGKPVHGPVHFVIQRSGSLPRANLPPR